MNETRPPANLVEALLELFQSVASGAVPLKHAISMARDLADTADFDDDGLLPMARSVAGAARAGHPLNGALMWRLVLEALDHARTDRQRAEAAEAVRAWLFVATFYLFERPDGRVRADAKRRGVDVAARLQESGDTAGAAGILHGMGAMLLDPYIERRDRKNYAAQTANWLAQGAALAFDLELPGALAMPEPREALAEAAAILRRAADLRSGRERGESLKAMSEALIWQSAAGGAIDRDQLSAAITEAWTLLDPNEDAVAVEMLARNAKAHGIPLPDRGTAAVPDAEELQRLQRDDPRGYIHAETTSAVHAADPREALEHLRRAMLVAVENGDEEERLRLMVLIANDAIRLFVIRTLTPAATEGDEWKAARDAIASRAVKEIWPPADRALAFLGLAFVASEADREDVSVPLIAEALELDVSDQPGLREALSTALVQLSFHFGATHFKNKRFLDACRQYFITCGEAVRFGLPGMARRNFGRAMQALDAGDDLSAPPIVDAAAQALPRVQSEVPDLAHDIRRFWLLAISHASFVAGRDDVVPIAVQAAKGASLLAARYAHVHRPVLEQPRVQAAIANWRRASAAVVMDTAITYDEEKLLVAHDDSLQQPGDTPAEQLENLSRQLDRTIASELARGAATANVIIGRDDLCANLPAGSVLVSVYPCFDEQRHAAYVTMLATNEGVVVRRARTGMPFMDLAVDGISGNDISGAVEQVRRQLLAPPERSDPTRALEWAFEYTFGAVEDDLAALHDRGYRHLCVNPHGALHFCPLSLLGRAGVPLADKWIVTHLPSVGLLARTTPAGHTRSGAGVFALSFDDARTGLTPLAAAPGEARSIAQAMKAEPSIDRDATPDRFTDAMQRCRWIHVATHGRQDPAAPALQTLYLHSGRRQVVPYLAFDVLQHQLHGVDLVTLSACETALGRIDINDNPRGLQAFLFTAGAATIVSCLWPVGDDVAAVFFERLYEALAADPSKKLDAFAAAQRTVREKFPERIDWGAFNYSGLWQAT